MPEVGAGEEGSEEEVVQEDAKGEGEEKKKGGKKKKEKKGEGKGKGKEKEKEKEKKESPFILYKDGEDYFKALAALRIWVNGLLVPVYGRETSTQRAWCPRWWEHIEAVAQFYGLWMAWQELTGGEAALSGPGNWHRDYLTPVMDSLRDPNGPFSGCKPGHHRVKEPPTIDEL
ncbi:DUF4913 domain-containing protein [Streptomyces sp. WAC 01325]|nr:DUF4913 domain-containing protein [Streptomyces sp. WAC 01325]